MRGSGIDLMTSFDSLHKMTLSLSFHLYLSSQCSCISTCMADFDFKVHFCMFECVWAKLNYNKLYKLWASNAFVINSWQKSRSLKDLWRCPLLPSTTTTTTATHHTHLLYLLGKRDVERKQGGRGGGRKREEKQIKSHKLLEMSLLRCENGERERKYMYNKDKGVEKDLKEILQLCNKKWWDSSPPALSTNQSQRTTFFFSPGGELPKRNWNKTLQLTRGIKAD